MRGAALLLGALVVAATAFWAYQVNYDTQAALDRAAALRADIARERDALRVLNAEWAWLNAPDRLQALVAAHQDQLRLGPMLGAHYARLEELRAPEIMAEPASQNGEARE
jgi:hypothetical protein